MPDWAFYFIGFMLAVVVMRVIEEAGSVLRDRRVNRYVQAELDKPYVPSVAAAWETRETIRKHDPALAMLLDAAIPVEKPKPPVPKRTHQGNNRGYQHRPQAEIDKAVYHLRKLHESQNFKYLLEEPTYETVLK